MRRVGVAWRRRVVRVLLAWRGRVGVLLLVRGRRRVATLAWGRRVAVVAVGRVGRVAGRRVGIGLCGEGQELARGRGEEPRGAQRTATQGG